MSIFNFDGDKTKWIQWSRKSIILARARGFNETYTTNMWPSFDIIFVNSATGGQKEIYKAN